MPLPQAEAYKQSWKLCQTNKYPPTFRLSRLATSRPRAVGEGSPHLFAHSALWVHLVAHLHVIGIVHDILYHVLQHCVSRKHRVDLWANVIGLKKVWKNIFSLVVLKIRTMKIIKTYFFSYIILVQVNTVLRYCIIFT